MKLKKVCYIFAAGEHFSRSEFAMSKGFVIAVDGGYEYTAANNIKADAVIGDFDSLACLPPKEENVLVLPVEKDDTDMVAAIRLGFEQGCGVFHIFGATGGRLDHTIANIQCLADITEKGGQAFLYDKDTIITAIKGKGCISFEKEKKGLISVFSHSDVSTGVCEEGLKYSLENATLKNTYPLGVSNEFVGEKSEVSVVDGMIIVIYPREK